MIVIMDWNSFLGPGLTLISLVMIVLSARAHAQNGTSMNLLLIMYDDLRPELPMYDRAHVIAPNFQRLAEKAVIFDHAYCQIAVCCPSRNSLLTGLRPDTLGGYNFQSSYHPYWPLPTYLVQNDYNTAGIGKIRHSDGHDRAVWNYLGWDNKWFDYQFQESKLMNSSVMPDKVTPEEKFRDAEFANKALETLAEITKLPKPFMLGLGFKLPHLSVHVPYKYYAMYKGKKKAWALTKRELKFPSSVSELSYRCCIDGPRFNYMREEGSKKHNRSVLLDGMNRATPIDAHDELAIGYAASVTFLDVQLGKVLDFMDKNDLWRNTVVVLTSDHGLHLGEKGIR